jgi:Tol biopolymer transport system component
MLRAHTPINRLLSTLAALVALLAVTGAVSGPAPAAFPGANGKLAFVRAGDIWVVDADGSNPTQLTTDPAQERSPAFSPDGTEIAFARRDGDFEIFVMAAGGGDIARQLTFNEGEQDRFPSWTADGAQIVYDKDFSTIYAVPADGAGGERKIANGFLPGTSPHGDKVVFAAPENDGLVTMHLDGPQHRRITTGPFDFSADWSPQGNDLVFTRSFEEGGRDVYAVHVDGSELVRLMNTPERFEFAPVWSPDGEKIAFVGCPDPSAGPGCQLYVVGRDGDGATPLVSFEVLGGEGAVDWQTVPKQPPARAAASSSRRRP